MKIVRLHVGQTANILTVFRILLVPILVTCFFLNTSASRFAAALLFITGCLTDFLDGYVARTYSQVSRLGQFLDPVADKLLISSTLLMLAGFGRLTHFCLIPSVIIMSREILISSLREYLSNNKVSVVVTKLAKIKTACQMIAICLLLMGETIYSATIIHRLGETMLWVSALLTLITGYQYLRESFSYI